MLRICKNQTLCRNSSFPDSTRRHSAWADDTRHDRTDLTEAPSSMEVETSPDPVAFQSHHYHHRRCITIVILIDVKGLFIERKSVEGGMGTEVRDADTGREVMNIVRAAQSLGLRLVALLYCTKNKDVE